MKLGGHDSVYNNKDIHVLDIPQIREVWTTEHNTIPQLLKPQKPVERRGLRHLRSGKGG